MTFEEFQFKQVENCLVNEQRFGSSKDIHRVRTRHCQSQPIDGIYGGKIACSKFAESDVALSGFRELGGKESHQLYSEDLTDFRFKLSLLKKFSLTFCPLNHL